MWILITAIVTASLMGSMHCVGMCGPLAIWASGGGERFGRRQMVSATALYHFGRLLTYALAGLIAGAMGQLVDLGGQALGVQLVAARIVGSLMIVFGSYQLWQLARGAQWLRDIRSGRPLASLFGTKAGSSRGATVGVATKLPRAVAPQAGNRRDSDAATLVAPKPNWITAQLMRLRPYVFRLPLPARGLATGLLTAFLPCGWLYLFALAAAGTGSMTMGPVVMAAFWVGTVPALVALVAGSQALALRFRRLVPTAVATTLIVAGGYTASGRGFAELHSLTEIHPGLAAKRTVDGHAALDRSATCSCGTIGVVTCECAGCSGSESATSGSSACACCSGDSTANFSTPMSAEESNLERLAAGIKDLAKTPLPCCSETATGQPDRSGVKQP